MHIYNKCLRPYQPVQCDEMSSFMFKCDPKALNVSCYICTSYFMILLSNSNYLTFDFDSWWIQRMLWTCWLLSCSLKMCAQSVNCFEMMCTFISYDRSLSIDYWRNNSRLSNFHPALCWTILVGGHRQSQRLLPSGLCCCVTFFCTFSYSWNT